MNPFEKFEPNDHFQAPNSLIGTIRLPTRSGRVMACTNHKMCRSANFCDRQTCELNVQDLFSTQEGVALLQKRVGCDYLGSMKEEKPSCKEKGINKDIKDDSNPGKCKINRKRVDRLFSEWIRKVVETEVEWKEFLVKTVLVEAAHGGKQTNTAMVKTLVHFRFIQDYLLWTDAKSHCESLGGHHFSQLDGSKQQLDDLLERMNPGAYWIGIRRQTSGNLHKIKMLPHRSSVFLQLVIVVALTSTALGWFENGYKRGAKAAAIPDLSDKTFKWNHAAPYLVYKYYSTNTGLLDAPVLGPRLKKLGCWGKTYIKAIVVNTADEDERIVCIRCNNKVSYIYFPYAKDMQKFTIWDQDELDTALGVTTTTERRNRASYSRPIRSASLREPLLGIF